MNRWGQRLDCCGFLGMCGQPVKCIRAHARGNGGKAKADCILANPPFNMSDWASASGRRPHPCL